MEKVPKVALGSINNNARIRPRNYLALGSPLLKHRHQELGSSCQTNRELLVRTPLHLCLPVYACYPRMVMSSSLFHSQNVWDWTMKYMVTLLRVNQPLTGHIKRKAKVQNLLFTFLSLCLEHASDFSQYSDKPNYRYSTFCSTSSNINYESINESVLHPAY